MTFGCQSKTYFCSLNTTYEYMISKLALIMLLFVALRRSNALQLAKCRQPLYFRKCECHHTTLDLASHTHVLESAMQITEKYISNVNIIDPLVQYFASGQQLVANLPEWGPIVLADGNIVTNSFDSFQELIQGSVISLHTFLQVPCFALQSVYYQNTCNRCISSVHFTCRGREWPTLTGQALFSSRYLFECFCFH